jgi:phosphatidylinositol alpha 1,6-mannosyltransferase
VRVAIVSECFLPVVNGVTNSVRRIVEHLGASGHDVLIVAPGDGQAERAGVPVVRLPALELPVVTSIPVGVPRGCTPGRAAWTPPASPRASAARRRAAAAGPGGGAPASARRRADRSCAAPGRRSATN